MSRKVSLIQVAVGILKDQEKILVAKRPDNKPYSGYWEFPGGKIEKNETGNMALKRELQEELGVEVLDTQFWFDHVHPYPDKTVLLKIYLVTAFSGTPYSKEKQVLRWVTFKELLALRLLEGNLSIVKQVISLCGDIKSELKSYVCRTK